MKTRLIAWAQTARAHVWTLLLLAYPFADQIIAGIEGWMPALAPHLGANAFRYMGLAIVSAKVALQVYRGWVQVTALLAKSEGKA
jgi:hypothetical protein